MRSTKQLYWCNVRTARDILRTPFEDYPVPTNGASPSFYSDSAPGLMEHRCIGCIRCLDLWRIILQYALEQRFVNTYLPQSVFRELLTRPRYYHQYAPPRPPLLLAAPRRCHRFPPSFNDDILVIAALSLPLCASARPRPTNHVLRCIAVRIYLYNI
jgi:hypothetical protein